MAGTVTVSEQTYGSVKKVTFTWLSSAGGAADATTVQSYMGQVFASQQVPDAGGTAPTDLYDVRVNDKDGVDVLNNTGANIKTADGFYNGTGCGGVAGSKLTLAVTNAGNAKGGKTIAWIR